MKFSSALNTMTIVFTLTVMVTLLSTGCNAAGCTLYGHSCWGGHGKRGIPDNMQPGGDNWLINRLARANLEKSAIPEMSYEYNRRALEIAKDRLFPRQLQMMESFPEGNSESDNPEYRIMKREIRQRPAGLENIEKYNLLKKMRNTDAVSQ